MFDFILNFKIFKNKKFIYFAYIIFLIILYTKENNKDINTNRLIAFYAAIYLLVFINN